MSGPAAPRVGVVGVGALGQHHARLLAASTGCRFAGVFDIDATRAAEVAQRHGTRAFARLRDLVDAVDAVCVAVPTVDHHRVARVLIEAGKDVLVEKPFTLSVEEADDLVTLARARETVLQVGHVERFNPAASVLQAVRDPRFVEVHRLASFSPRSLDIDVVLDLMIHDLDILLTLDRSEIRSLEAVGVAVLTARFDIANARLRFASGLTANLTASRISAERLRKFRVWSPGGYVSVDFAAREAQVYRLVGGGEGRPEITMERVGAPEEEPLARQLAAFLGAVRDRQTPVVTGEDGRRALEVAHAILEKMDAPRAA